MSGKKEEKKTFKKVEGGMLYIDEKGEVLFIGLPKKVKEVTGGKAGFFANLLKGGGAEVSGRKESEIDYHWVRMATELPLPTEEKKELEYVTRISGTIAATSSTVAPVSTSNICPKCGTWNLNITKFCRKCGWNL